MKMLLLPKITKKAVNYKLIYSSTISKQDLSICFQILNLVFVFLKTLSNNFSKYLSKLFSKNSSFVKFLNILEYPITTIGAVIFIFLSLIFKKYFF